MCVCVCVCVHACVCMDACVCACVGIHTCMHKSRIVSTDKMLHFIYKLYINHLLFIIVTGTESMNRTSDSEYLWVTFKSL